MLFMTCIVNSSSAVATQFLNEVLHSACVPPLYEWWAEEHLPYLLLPLMIRVGEKQYVVFLSALFL